MQNQTEKKSFIEDSFELVEFKESFRLKKRRKERIRRDKKAMRLFSVLIVILLLFMAFTAYRILLYDMEMKKSALINEMAYEVATGTTGLKTDDGPEATASIETTDGDENATVSDPKPDDENKPVLDKIAKLREAFSNEEIIGYLQIAGTNIDYAVTQAEDNEFYLSRDLYGEKNAAGSIFMDYECDAAMLSQNTVIYGHNMRNGSMFHNLRYYADEAFYREHNIISLTTPYEETLWEVFAFYQTGTDFYYIQVIFPDDDAFESLLSTIKEKSMYDAGVSVSAADKILTLSTCVNTTDEARYVLNARLISE